MQMRNRRLALLGVLIAAAIAVPAVALAAISPSGKAVPSPSASFDSAAAASKSAAAASGASVNRSVTGPQAVDALARRLGVSSAAARRALQQISALSGTDGVDPTDPVFAAIARGVGVSPNALAAGLDAVKQAVAGA